MKLKIDPVQFADVCDNRDRDLSQMLVNNIIRGVLPEVLYHQVVYCLVELEVKIIRLEHFLANKPFDNVSNQERVERYKREHKGLYSKLVKALGKKKFQALYKKTLDEHNRCAKEYLKNSGGKARNYVLPKFNPDGTHEPWGDKDVPWSLFN